LKYDTNDKIFGSFAKIFHLCLLQTFTQLTIEECMNFQILSKKSWNIRETTHYLFLIEINFIKEFFFRSFFQLFSINNDFKLVTIEKPSGQLINHFYNQLLFEKEIKYFPIRDYNNYRQKISSMSLSLF
jgi:hypothetical protein